MTAEVDTISLTVRRDLLELVQAAVDRGEFASPSELVCAALDEWKANREESPEDIERLRQLWDEGIASGPGKGLSIEEIMAEGRRRLAKT